MSEDNVKVTVRDFSDPDSPREVGTVELIEGEAVATGSDFWRAWVARMAVPHPTDPTLPQLTIADDAELFIRGVWVSFEKRAYMQAELQE